MTPLPPSQNQSGRFRVLTNEIRDMVLVFLSAQVNELFSSTDEALLDFAEQAENSMMQGRFFEAMGAVRKHRSEIEHEFRTQVHNGFGRFGTAARDTATGDEEEELSLIEPDDMEESVAQDNLIMRSRSRYFAEIYALSQRMAVLNGGRKVPEDAIPGGPSHLVKSYRAALAMLVVDVKSKIVLYALFDKFVMQQLKGLYDEINDNLKHAGILPNLKPVYRTPQSKDHGTRKPREPARPSGQAEQAADAAADGAHSQAAAGQTEGTTSLGEELFDSILDLMASRRTGSGAHFGGPIAQAATGHPTTAAGSGEPAFGAADAGTGAGSGRVSLMAAIDKIRPSSTMRPGGVLTDPEKLPQIAVDPHFIDNLKHTLADERRQILSEVDQEDIQGIDADTIDLIGMLFEYMLNDPLLPNVAKALLSHLHTPYLKLALIDRQLLVDSEHPARLLLDMLVDAGGQWVYENDTKRGIFPQLQTVVDRVLQEFSDDQRLFDELLDYFTAAMEEQKRKSESIEHRAQESVKGREKLHVAKKRAAQEMASRTSRTPLPKSAERFLAQAWSDRLVFILLRHDEGDRSPEWTSALEVADKLVRLFQPGSAGADEASVRADANWIRQEIDNALDSLGGYHQHYLEELLAILDDPVAARRRHERQEDTVVTPFPGTAGGLAGTVGAESPPPGKGHRPVTADQSVGHPLPSEEQTADRAPLSPREQDMLDRLHKVKFGTWFEFKDNGRQSRRLKLSWLSPLTSTCMFVDRSGAQAEVKSLEEIARMLVSGGAKVIPRPKHQFVERALMAIRRTLQRSMEDTE